jgi:hypothetical protein
MQDNFAQTPNPDSRGSQPRRFVYRSTQPDAHDAHPMRRCTDIPCPYQANTAPLYPRPLLLKMCVYLKAN